MQGQDVSESLAVEVATQYYERVKNDNPGEHISRILTNNQTRSDRYPELISPLCLAGMCLVPVDDGWVLVSSNTKTTPILAHYQTDRKPVYDLLAPGEKYLLDWYEHEIAYANDIKEYQHLPEIPSAEQMQEEGMSVDKMVVKLLQKVEELTLYTIQQEERIKELEKNQK